MTPPPSRQGLTDSGAVPGLPCHDPPLPAWATPTPGPYLACHIMTPLYLPAWATPRLASPPRAALPDVSQSVTYGVCVD